MLQLTLSDLLNSLSVVIGVAALVIPLHLQNRRTQRKQRKMARKAWRAIKRHERECWKRWELTQLERSNHEPANSARRERFSSRP